MVADGNSGTNLGIMVFKLYSEYKSFGLNLFRN